MYIRYDGFYFLYTTCPILPHKRIKDKFSFVIKLSFHKLSCGVPVVHLFSFLCCPIMCLYVLSSVFGFFSLDFETVPTVWYVFFCFPIEFQFDNMCFVKLLVIRWERIVLISLLICVNTTVNLNVWLKSKTILISTLWKQHKVSFNSK